MTTIAAMTRSDDMKRMAEAIAFLAGRYREQPSLEAAAASVGLSPFHFQRLFSAHVGVSPKAFVGHLTLAQAKRALAQGDSVLSAALEAGLSGPSRLYDLCLKIEAMTPGDYAKAGAGLTVAYGFSYCPFGLAILAATEKGVCGLGFGNVGEETAMTADMTARWPKARFFRDDAKASALIGQIFGPEQKAIMPLHLIGTPFQLKVWQALLAIPSGGFSTYGTLAGRLNQPKAARAVGAAVGRNPISWLIPCHRVLGSTGALTGYHWGLPRKRAMLAVEAARRDYDDRPSTSVITSDMV
jgi:AraC family transcriptional regulator, regulatory protein of adaptative response / methylated-DNA-[protein]-cysteine methyltransferase